MPFQLAYIYPADGLGSPPLVHLEGGDADFAVDVTVRLVPEDVRGYREQLFLLCNRVARLHPRYDSTGRRRAAGGGGGGGAGAGGGR